MKSPPKLAGSYQRPGEGQCQPECRYVPSSPSGILIQAFWAGDLAIYPPGSETSTSRETFLEGLRTYSEGSGIAFFEATPPEQEPPEEPKEFYYDLRPHLVVPADASNWTPEVLNRAYAILAKDPSIEDFPQPFLIAFKTHHIDREKFAHLCERRNWGLPSSWLSPRRRKRRYYDEDHCRAWFATQVRGPQKHLKDGYAKRAHTRFGIPRYKFDQIWALLAPPEWKRRGRRRIK